jgi:hypothetical protein
MWREIVGRPTGIERHWKEEKLAERRAALEKALLDAEVNLALGVLERMVR